MNTFLHHIRRFFGWTRSHVFQTIIMVLSSLLILLLVFQAGVFVGFHKAMFMMRHSERMEQFGHGKGMRGAFGTENDGHGAYGSVVSMATSSLIVADPDHTEKVVSVATSTQVRRGNDSVTLQDIHPGDTIIVFGIPENGTINASLIRILPPKKNELFNR